MMADETTKGLFDEDTIVKDDNFELEEDIDPSTVDMSALFETLPEKEDPKETVNEEKEQKINHTEEVTPVSEAPVSEAPVSEVALDNVPAPTAKETEPEENAVDEFINQSKEVTEKDWSVDEILALITGHDENGHAPAGIYVSLERLTGVTEEMNIEDLTEDQREIVEDIVIHECSIDFFALNTEIANLVFTFDSPKDAYLHEFNALLNRYRIMQEKLGTEPENDVLPMLTIAIAPDELLGRCIMLAAFPLAFFRTLDDTGMNASLHTMFYMNNIQFSKIEITEEEQRDAIADVMRDVSAGANGQLFEE